jgi:signal transduction histidine kinase
VLTLNIEDIDKSQHSSALKRAKKSIMYLDGMVDQVRSQLQGSSRSAMFSVPEKINETSKLLSDKLTFTNVKIELITQHDSKKLVCLGDPIRFQQIMTILISNSIDAYKGIRKINGHAAVRIHVKSVQRSIVISIQDDGIGISDSARHNLFKPFYSTKKEGMGIGLFIAKQMVETHFKGEIAITDTDSFTEFVVSLPKAYTRGAKKT